MMFLSRTLAIAVVFLVPTDASIRSKLKRQLNDWGSNENDFDEDFNGGLEDTQFFEMMAEFTSDFEDCGIDLSVFLGDESMGSPPDPMQMLQDIKLSLLALIARRLLFAKNFWLFKSAADTMSLNWMKIFLQP